MTRNCEDRASENGYTLVVHGVITNTGLLILLGALWGLDPSVRKERARMESKFWYVMEECGGTMFFESGSVLIVSQKSPALGDEPASGQKSYRIRGTLEEAELDAIMNRGIENEWTVCEDDELGFTLTLDIRETDDEGSSSS
jgi:hypothetical protein